MNDFIIPMQAVTGFGQLSALQQMQEKEEKTQGAEGIAAFKDVFEDVLNMARTSEADVAEKEYLLATGQLDNPHLLTIATSQAQLSTDLLVSIRNKALESFNELMRISV